MTLGGQLGSYAGLKVVVNAGACSNLVGYDFSKCRSPSRAERRYKKRDIVSRHMRPIVEREAYRIGNTLYIHPLDYETLKGQCQ